MSVMLCEGVVLLLLVIHMYFGIAYSIIRKEFVVEENSTGNTKPSS